MLHSGSARYYSGRLSVRYDFIPPDRLEAAVEHSRKQEYTRTWCWTTARRASSSSGSPMRRHSERSKPELIAAITGWPSTTPMTPASRGAQIIPKSGPSIFRVDYLNENPADATVRVVFVTAASPDPPDTAWNRTSNEMATWRFMNQRAPNPMLASRRESGSNTRSPMVMGSPSRTARKAEMTGRDALSKSGADIAPPVSGAKVQRQLRCYGRQRVSTPGRTSCRRPGTALDDCSEVRPAPLQTLAPTPKPGRTQATR